MSPRSDVDRGLVQADREAQREQKYHVTSTVLDDVIATTTRQGNERPRYLRATSVSLHEPARRSRRDTFAASALLCRTAEGLGTVRASQDRAEARASRSLLGTRSSFLGLG